MAPQQPSEKAAKPAVPSTRGNGNNRLGPNTLVPLGAVVAVILSAAAGAVWVNNVFMELRHQLEQVRFELADMKETVGRQMDDRWRARDMQSWAKLLQAQNPELKVPIPE